MNESQALCIAKAIGGTAFHTGGNIWVVHFNRPDGKLVEIGDGPDGELSALVFTNHEHRERYSDGGGPLPEYIRLTD